MHFHFRQGRETFKQGSVAPGKTRRYFSVTASGFTEVYDQNGYLHFATELSECAAERNGIQPGSMVRGWLRVED